MRTLDTTTGAGGTSAGGSSAGGRTGWSVTARAQLVKLRAAALALTAGWLVVSGCGLAHGQPGEMAIVERAAVVAPGTPPAPATSDPARAAVERWLPSRADDAELVSMVDRAMRSGRGRAVARRATETVDELAAVRELVVDQGMPDLFLGIPYWESYFDDAAVSRSCAAGVWQLMPETAAELGLKVGGCHIGDSVWSPVAGDVANPASPYRAADPEGAPSCAISLCEDDERLDLAASTRGAVEHLRRMWEASGVVDSPDRAGLVVVAYNTGLGAILAHVRATDGDALGDLAQCADAGCSTLSAQGANYLPGVLASAALATCAASDVPGTRFEADRDSTLCKALREQGLIADPRAPKLTEQVGARDRG